MLQREQPHFVFPATCFEPILSSIQQSTGQTQLNSPGRHKLGIAIAELGATNPPASDGSPLRTTRI